MVSFLVFFENKQDFHFLPEFLIGITSFFSLFCFVCFGFCLFVFWFCAFVFFLNMNILILWTQRGLIELRSQLKVVVWNKDLNTLHKSYYLAWNINILQGQKWKQDFFLWWDEELKLFFCLPSGQKDFCFF